MRSVFWAGGGGGGRNHAQAVEARPGEGGSGPLAEAPGFHPTGEQNFIKSLIHFDKDNISDKVLKKIGAYCAQPDFQPDIIGRVSLAAKSLCMWVRAMEVSGPRAGSGAGAPGWGGGEAPGGGGGSGRCSRTVSQQLYGRLYRVVEPKRVRMNVALAQLQEKQAALAEAQEKLREVSRASRPSFPCGPSPQFPGCSVAIDFSPPPLCLPVPSASCSGPFQTGCLWLRS